MISQDRSLAFQQLVRRLPRSFHLVSSEPVRAGAGSVRRGGDPGDHRPSRRPARPTPTGIPSRGTLATATSMRSCGRRRSTGRAAERCSASLSIRIRRLLRMSLGGCESSRGGCGEGVSGQQSTPRGCRDGGGRGDRQFHASLERPAGRRGRTVPQPGPSHRALAPRALRVDGARITDDSWPSGLRRGPTSDRVQDARVLIRRRGCCHDRVLTL